MFADRFVLERELGSGGMAHVFLGRDEVLDRPVAVKVLDPVHGDTDIGDRFQREGRTAARLTHPNIVQVYDAGKASLDGRDTSYIVMEYVPGGDLKALIDKRRRLSGPELARLGGEVSAGLAHAHERGVVHRDIKPHNILLDENGHAKVTDFGIARALDTTQATRTGSFLGTALYSSPEQLQGKKVTPKSDVYSLGATLYQAATGAPPFSGATPLEIASQHVSQTPVPPRRLDADVGEDVQALILDCLAKNPDDRPTVDEVRSTLEKTQIRAAAPPAAPPAAAATSPTREEQTSPEPAAPATEGGGAVRTEKGRRRSGLLAILAVLAVIAVVGALAAPNLFEGNGGGGGPGNSGENDAQAGGNEGRSGGQPGGQPGGGGPGNDQGAQGSGGGATQSATASASAEPSASSQSSSASPAAAGKVPKKGDFTASAAEDTVQAFYTMTSDGEYDRSAMLLSQDWRQSTFPNRAVFEGTFDKVKSVDFIEGPKARVSGNNATVTGETNASLAGEVQHNKGTWYLVQEDGRWKIDGWDVVKLSSRPA
jgi:eukaryotic-like serine/threonine-protein kinase